MAKPSELTLVAATDVVTADHREAARLCEAELNNLECQPPTAVDIYITLCRHGLIAPTPENRGFIEIYCQNRDAGLGRSL